MWDRLRIHDTLTAVLWLSTRLGMSGATSEEAKLRWSRHLWVERTCWGRRTFTLQLSIKYWAMDFPKASKKYQEYCRAHKHQSENETDDIHVRYNYTPCQTSTLYEDVTFSSLLLVRKSVDGFRMAVMALASSSCTNRAVEDVYGSVLNTNCKRHSEGHVNPPLQTWHV